MDGEAGNKAGSAVKPLDNLVNALRFPDAQAHCVSLSEKELICQIMQMSQPGHDVISTGVQRFTHARGTRCPQEQVQVPIREAGHGGNNKSERQRTEGGN